MSEHQNFLNNLNIQMSDPEKPEKREGKETPIVSKVVLEKKDTLPLKRIGIGLLSGIIFALFIYIFVPFSLAEKAKRGNLDAQYNYALQFFNQENYDQYLYWMNKSADQKNLQAHFNLGLFYKDSQTYTNYEKAEKHLKFVADFGNSEAQLLLGKMYKDGLGTKQNYQKAREYLKKSADQGNKEASFLTATLYALGQGGPQDYKVAYAYAKKCTDDSQSPLIQLLESKIKKE